MRWAGHSEIRTFVGHALWLLLVCVGCILREEDDGMTELKGAVVE